MYLIQYIPGNLHVFIHTGYPTIFTMDENFSLDCKAAILGWRKEINRYVYCEYKSFMVLWMLNPGTTEYVNTVFYHILSSRNQYRICLLRTRRCTYPIMQVLYAKLCTLLCLLSYSCLHTYVVCYAYLVYCPYSYTE